MEQINRFIKDEYLPKYLEEFKSRVPAGTDYEKEFSGMVQAIVSEVLDRTERLANLVKQ